MASTVPEGQRSARPVRSERQESFPGSPLALPARPSGRSPLATLTGVQILGLGAYVPEQVVRKPLDLPSQFFSCLQVPKSRHPTECIADLTLGRVCLALDEMPLAVSVLAPIDACHA